MTQIDQHDEAVAAAQIDAAELDQYRVQMVRYAQWVLGNRAAAEDAVQDTLLAALRAPAPFAGRSSVRTWLFGILRHKLMDEFRRQSREVPFDEDDDDDDGSAGAEAEGALLHADGSDPERQVDRKRFFEVLERCLQRLPRKTARAFTMREVLGMDTDAICAALDITRDNCFVILHRARLALRGWLAHDWADAVPRRAVSGVAG